MTTPLELCGPFGAHTGVLALGPAIEMLTDPLGATAPVEPTTVAIKTSEPPKVGVEELVIVSVGVIAKTDVPLVEVVTATAL